MDVELRFHIEAYANDLVRKGLHRQEAMRRARLEFGGIERAKEECREARGVTFFESLAQDIRFGLRMLRKSPGFTAVAVLTLALGIGATTGIFSVVSAVLVRSLPFQDPSRLVALFQTPDTSHASPMGWASDGPDILDWQRDSRSFSAIAASLLDGANVTGAGSPQHLSGEKVTANYFDLLGVQAAFGRTFARGEDESGQREVIISYSVWRNSFGGQNILGRTIHLDGQPFVVIGVMPAIFHDPRTWANPLSNYWTLLPKAQLTENRGRHMYASFGRLAPGVTIQQAQQEMDIVGQNEAKQFPNSNAGMGVRVSSLEQVNLQTFEEGHFQSVSPAILLLQLAAGFLLLIACANVANLMLSRLVARNKEFALRSAMGASRWRSMRQLLTESILLSVLAGAAGILFAVWCKKILIALAPTGYLPATANIQLDMRVLAFTLGISTLTGILFGFFPALRASRHNPNEDLKSASQGDSPSRLHFRRALVVLELAATFLLLIGGGLMVRSLSALLAVNPGFNPQNFFTASISLPAQQYAKPGQILQFFSTVQQKVQNLPGVDAAAFTSSPEFIVTNSSSIFAEGYTPPTSVSAQVWPQICFITPHFFRAADVPLLQGRDFSSADIAGNARIAIISQALGEHFWPHQSWLGKRLRWGNDSDWREVVGVVGNVRQKGLAAPSLPEVYIPLISEIADAENSLNIVARSSAPTALLAQEIQEQVAAVDAGIPLSEPRSGDQILVEWAGYLRYRAVLLASFAAMALLIAAIGVFGAISYTTAQRTHEIGIRVALGAQRNEVFRLIIFQGGKLALAGLAIGIIFALAFTRMMASLLYGITASDPVTFIAVAIVLTLVALLACYIPARRATRVDPLVALRYE